MKLYRTPSILKTLFPNLIWDLKNNSREIYLTFDDGPIPGVTEYVLDILEKYKAKATFFCVGQNVETNTQIFQCILKQGHTIGNHTYDHLNGWKTRNGDYFQSISFCEKVFKENGYFPGKKYFRPPYGKIKLSQVRELQRDYRIIMWDLLSMDFDLKQTPEECLEKTKKYTRPGSVIVFHDSLKTKNKIKFVLERLLDFLETRDFHFRCLEEYVIKEGC
ncbi:polysaccharide deacetylase family protein [Bacteroidota bacterium]